MSSMDKVIQWFGILLGVMVMIDRVVVEEEAKKVLEDREIDSNLVYAEVSCDAADGCNLD